MEENKYIFRAVDPRSDDDIKILFELRKKLSEFLKDRKSFDENIINWQRWHWGAPEYVFPEDYKDKSLRDVEKIADEFAFVCEKDGAAVGYILVDSYHVVDGERPNDDIGIIGEIFVLPEHRKKEVSYNLIQMGINKLIQKGKHRAICDVQDDNEFKYLHFAMADGNVVHQYECERKDGNKTVNYTLLIDLKKIKDLSPEQLILKTARMKRKMIKAQNLDLQADC